MATYLDKDLTVATKEFTPNYSFIMRTLQLQQTQYDQGFSKVKSVYNSILNADLTGDDHKERRNQIIANAENSLKNLPTIDLSLPQNVTTAKKAFQPFYDDDALLEDIVFTKSSKSNAQSGAALQNAVKEEDRDRYWGTGVQYIMDGMEQYRTATDEERKGMSARRYVAKPNVDKQILDMFKDGKIKMSRDTVSGQVKYTDENGAALKDPLTNLYLARAENDPEVMEAFKVMGSVARTGYIRNNAERFGGKQQAQEVFDNNMIRQYKDNKQYQIDKINESLENVSTQADIWEQQAKSGNLKQKDAAQAAKDIADRDRLKQSLKSAQSAMNESDERIRSNPEAYLGNIYLNKNANDLATALSQFGSRKIDTNPLYKDLVLPFKLKEFEHELSKQMEKIKADETIRINAAKAETDASYDDGAGGGGGSTSTGGGTRSAGGGSNLNIPFIEETRSGAAVPLIDDLDQADAYTLQRTKTNEIISDLGSTKLRLIETVLNNNEIVDSKGNYISTDKRGALLSNGKDLDRLYNLAVKKHNAYAATKDPKMYNSLDLIERAKSLNDVWSASIAFRQEKLGEITNQLAGLEEKSDGYIYKSLLKDGLVPGNSDVDRQEFLNRVSESKEFKAKADALYKKNSDEYYKEVNKLQLTRFDFDYKTSNPPTLQQAKTQMLAQIGDNFKKEKYQKNVTQTWNKNSYSYYADDAKKGGGIYGRIITYQGSNTAKGEKADVYAQDLFEKVLSPFSGDDKIVKVNTHSADATKGDIKNNDKIKDVLMGRIKNDIFTAIRVGKGSDLGSYSIGFSGVAGDKGEYNKYTLKFDQDYVNKLIETKTKAGGSSVNVNIDATTAKSLMDGIDIFVKKDKDTQSQMARASTIGEIDILLNDSRNQNSIKREILPGYGVQIEKLHTGGYRMIYNYKQYSKDNLNGVDKTEEAILPEGTDITNAYYESLKKARLTYDANKAGLDMIEQQMKNDPNMQPVTYQQLLEMSKNIGTGY